MKYEPFPILIKEYNLTGYPQKQQLINKVRSSPSSSHPSIQGKGSSNHNTNLNQTSGNFILQNSFNSLLNAFNNSIKDYSQEVGIKQGKISNTWFNIQESNSKLHEHHHPGAAISGAYYPLLEYNTCNLVFHSPLSIYRSNWHQKTNDYSPYSGEDFTISIKPDHLYIFPGWLNHSTERNKAKQRIVISFNVDPWFI
tara:strand:+ start:88 stop:678 length:591 start_codon:yes stop_codon:yes gene_type:complete